MLAVVMLFLSKNWLAVGAGVGCGLLVLALGIDHARLSHAKSDLTAARVEIVGLKADIATDARSINSLKVSIAQQNAAVDQMQAAGEARDVAASKATADARTAASGLRSAAQRVLEAKAGADKCASADQIILGALQ